MFKGGKGGKGGILSVAINNEDALYEHYMAFVQGGGCICPDKKKLRVG